MCRQHERIHPAGMDTLENGCAGNRRAIIGLLLLLLLLLLLFFIIKSFHSKGAVAAGAPEVAQTFRPKTRAKTKKHTNKTQTQPLKNAEASSETTVLEEFRGSLVETSRV